MTIHCSAIKKTKRQRDPCFLRRQVFSRVQSPFFNSVYIVTNIIQCIRCIEGQSSSSAPLDLESLGDTSGHIYEGIPRAAELSREGHPESTQHHPIGWSPGLKEGGETDRQTDDRLGEKESWVPAFIALDFLMGITMWPAVSLFLPSGLPLHDWLHPKTVSQSTQDTVVGSLSQQGEKQSMYLQIYSKWTHLIWSHCA